MNDHNELMPKPTTRSGATMIECAFALPVMLMLLFGMLDLGLAAARYNALSDAARRVARAAIIHGSLESTRTAAWGPQEFAGTAADNSPIAMAANAVLPAMPKDEVNIHVSWPDNNNSPGDRVQVEISYRHQPLLPRLFAWGPLTLRAVSTMQIVN
jgi:Flp pilus assembly protein TadG